MSTSSAGKGTVTKSELIERIAQKQMQLAYKDVELAVKSILEHMAQTLASGKHRSRSGGLHETAAR